MDEWFKKNWIVTDYEIPPENTRLWHNVMDAEQSSWTTWDLCGDERSHAGTPENRLPVGCRSDAYDSALNRPEGGPQGSPCRSDESYHHTSGRSSLATWREAFPWDTLGIRIALDTWSRNQGQMRLPERNGQAISGSSSSRSCHP